MALERAVRRALHLGPHSCGADPHPLRMPSTSISFSHAVHLRACARPLFRANDLGKDGTPAAAHLDCPPGALQDEQGG